MTPLYVEDWILLGMTLCVIVVMVVALLCDLRETARGVSSGDFDDDGIIRNAKDIIERCKRWA